jgi:hypothetical protein
VPTGRSSGARSKPEQVPGSFVKRSPAGFSAGSAPPAANFYADGRNGSAGNGSVVKQVLGVDAATLDRQYVSYVEKARGG